MVVTDLMGRVVVTDLIRQVVGQDVHLEGDGVHNALPPGQAIFIWMENTRAVSQGVEALTVSSASRRY